jgi:hypothetical protein
MGGLVGLTGQIRRLALDRVPSRLAHPFHLLFAEPISTVALIGLAKMDRKTANKNQHMSPGSNPGEAHQRQSSADA